MYCSKWALSHYCQCNHFLQVQVIHQQNHPGVRYSLLKGTWLVPAAGLDRRYSVTFTAQSHLQKPTSNHQITACGRRCVHCQSWDLKVFALVSNAFPTAVSQILLTFTFLLNYEIVYPCVIFSWLIPYGIWSPLNLKNKRCSCMIACRDSWLILGEVPGYLNSRFIQVGYNHV